MSSYLSQELASRSAAQNIVSSLFIFAFLFRIANVGNIYAITNASPQVKPSEAPFGGIRWVIDWDVLKKMIYLFVAAGNGGRKSFSVIYKEL
jgi:hypothetical protein